MSTDFRIELFSTAEHFALLPELTALLHRAYRPLAEKNLHYTASHQPAETTHQRITEDRGWIFFVGEELAGTVSLYEGVRKETTCDYYRRPGVYLFGQFAVDPALQGRGIGGRVMKFLENEARQIGARELALDTSEHAADLIATYARRGYVIVDHTQWPDVNYRSVIMSKRL